MMLKDIQNYFKEISENAYIRNITIQANIDKSFVISKLLDVITIKYLIDKRYDIKDKKFTIKNKSSFTIEDMKNYILICSSDLYPFDSFFKDIENELKKLSNYIDFNIKDYLIKNITIECFTEDDLIKNLIKEDFYFEKIFTKELNIEFVSEKGKMSIKYASMYDIFKKRYPISIYSRIKNIIEKIRIPSFYRLNIEGDYEYVKEILDKLKKHVELSSLYPRASFKDVIDSIKKDPTLSEREKALIFRFLRDIENESLEGYRL